MKVSPNDLVVAGNIKLPKDRYTVRVVKSEFGPSKNKGIPMCTLTCEIMGRGEDMSPTVEVDGVKYNIAGAKYRMNLFYTYKADTGKGGISFVYEFMRKIGLEVPEDGVDLDNPDYKAFEGKVFDAILSSKERIARKSIKPGQSIGDPILDAEGNQIIEGNDIVANVQDVLGLSKNS